MAGFMIDIQDVNPDYVFPSVQDSEYVLIGGGPIADVQSWDSTQRLDRGGTWSFEIPATDEKAQHLREKRFVQAYAPPRSTATEIGGGRIEKITHTVTADGTPVLRCSGIDPLAELTSIVLNSAITVTGGTSRLSDVIGHANAKVLASNGLTWVVDDTVSSPSFDLVIPVDKTALGGLIYIGETIGEHFRYGNGRNIEWIGAASSFVNNDIFAVGHGNPNQLASQSGLCVITAIERVRDSRSLVNRVYPTAQGPDADTPVTIDDATDAVPSGYTRNTTDNYLEDDSSITSWTLHEHRINFSGIEADEVADMPAAGNELQAAVIEYLRLNSEPHEFFNMTVVCQELIRPGDKMHVYARKMKDGASYIDIDGEMIVLESSTSITQAGSNTTGILAATIDRWPDRDLDLLVRNLAK